MSEVMKLETFEPIRDRFIALGYNEQQFNREASFAAMIINGSEQLQECTTGSKLAAVMQVANIGLSLNPVRKEAYLVTRYIRGKGKVAHLEPSYQGLVKLITDTGSVTSVYSHLVHDGDEFEVSLGTETKITHKPKFKNKSITHVYAVAVLKDGSKQIEVMDVDDVNEIREISESYKAFKDGRVRSCVWVDHYGEMARKTVIRRLVKYLPKTDEFNRVHEAIALDESDYPLTFQQEQMIETMLRRPLNLTPERIDQISRTFTSYSSHEAAEVITELLRAEEEVDPINGGYNYSQTQIQNKLASEKD